MKLNWDFRKAWLISLAVKILIAVLIPLSLDETYYWFWGQHPQLSYYDHPPMVAWLFTFGNFFSFLGGGAVRIPGVFLGQCTLLIWNEILKPYLSESQRTLWLIFVLLSPLVGWGSLIQTPDISLLFFWSLSLLAFDRALKTKTLSWYIILGVSLGLGFCSKYPIVLFVPTLFLYLLVEKKFSEVRWSFVIVSFIFGLAFCAPVLLWNAGHDWISFKFQLNHGLGSQKPSLFWPLKYLIEQFLFLFPTTVIFFFRSRLPKDLRYLYYFALFPLGFFLFSAFKSRVEPNWPIAAYPAFLSIAFFSLSKSAWLKRTVSLWAVVFVLILVQTFFPFIPVNPSKLKTNEFHKFDAFLPYAQNSQPVYASSYQLASWLSFKLKKDIPKLQGMNRKDFFDFYPPSKPTTDDFILLMDGSDPLPDWTAQEGFEVVKITKLTEQFSIIEMRKRAKASNT